MTPRDKHGNKIKMYFKYLKDNYVHTILFLRGPQRWYINFQIHTLQTTIRFQQDQCKVLKRQIKMVYC